MSYLHILLFLVVFMHVTAEPVELLALTSPNCKSGETLKTKRKLLFYNIYELNVLLWTCNYDRLTSKEYLKNMCLIMKAHTCTK